MPESEGGESADLRRKKVQRFRRHRGIETTKRSATLDRVDVPPVPVAVAAAAKPAPPTKPAQRDLRSVTRRRNDSATGKRDKLVHKLRSGKDRFATHPTKSESEFLEEQRDVLDQSDSVMSNSSAGEHMRSVDSIMSADYSESDSKLSVATENSDDALGDSQTAADTGAADNTAASADNAAVDSAAAAATAMFEKHRRKGKRDKLVSKLRAGRDRSVAHASKSESSLLEEKSDALDQSGSMRSTKSAREYTQSIDSMLSADYLESDSMLAVAVNNSDEKITDDTATGTATPVINSHAEIEDDDPGDDVVDAILERQMQLLEDDESDAGSSGVDEPADSEQEPHRQRLISQIKTRKIEQKAEMQAEAERLREEKEVAAQAETYRILERKAAEARAEAEFLTRAAEKAKTGRVAKAEAARRRLEAKRSREAAERAEKERQLEEQRSIEQEAAAEKGRRREEERIVEHEAAAEKARGIEEERIVEQGAAAEKARGMEEERIVEEEAAELFEIEQSTANKSMSPAMSLKSTGDTDVGAKLNSPRKRRSPRKKRLVIQISEDSSATADDEQKGDELMGSPKTKPGINHAPNSATEKGPTDEIREHRSEGLEGSIAHREVGFHTDTQPKNVPSFDEPQDSGTEQLAFDEFLVSRRNQFDDPPSTLAAPKQGSTVHTQSTRSPEKALLEGVVSVGHGAPATRSCLFLEQLEEDSLSEDETINESIQTPKSAVVEASPTSKAAAFVSATSRNLQQSAPKEINFGHFAFPESPLAVEKQLQRAISDEQPVDESIASPNMSAGSWSSEPVTTNRGAIGKTILRTRSPEKASPEKVKEAGLIASPKKPLVSKQLQDSKTDEQYEQSCDELMGSPRSTGEVRSPNSMTTTQEDSSIHILPSPQTSPNKSGPQEVELVYVAAPTSSLTIEQQASEFNADEDGPGDELMGLSPRSPFSKSIAIKIPDDDSVQVLSPDGIPDKSIYKEMHVGYVASPKSPQTGLAQLKEESSDELIGLRRSTIVEPLRSSTTSVENSIAEMQSPTKSPVVSQKSPLFAKKQKDFVTVEGPVDQSLVSPRNKTPVIQSPNSIQPNGDSVAQTHSPENFEQGSATVDMGSDISLKNTQLTDEQQQPAAVDEFRDDLVHCPKSAPIGQTQQQDFTSEEVSVDELMVSPRSKVVMQLPEANGGSVVQTHSPVSLEKGPATADMGSVIFPNNTQLVEGKQEAAAVSELIDELIPSPRSISTASSLRLTSTTAESVRQVQSSESSEKCPSALIIDNIACPEQEPTIAKSHDKLVRFPKRTAAMQTSWSAIQNEDCDQVQTGGSPEKSIASGELAAAIAPSKSPKSGEQVHHSVNGSMDSPRNRGTGRSPRSMTLKESISQSESLSDPDMVGIASSSDAKITSQLIKSDTSEESVDEIMGSRKSPTVSLEKYGSQEGVVDEIQESRSIETGLKTDDNGGKTVDSSKSSSVGIQQSDLKEPLNVLMESPKGRPGIVSPKARSDERCADEISMVSSAESGVRLSPAMTTSASDVFPERDLPDQELSILAEQDQPITSTEGPSNGAGTMEEGHVDTVGLDVGVQGSNERKNSLKKELHSTSFVADSSLVQSEDLVIMHTKDVEILEGLVEEQSKAKSTSEDDRKKAVKDNTEGHFGDPESNSTVGTPPPPPPLKKRRSRRRDKKPPLEDSKSIDVVDDEKPSKPLAPAPPPPEKRASARGKRHSSPASKVRLQVITKNLSSDEMNAEPRKIGTPPPPPPLTTLSARKRRRAAANAINLEHDRNEDTETIGGSPQQKARVGEKEALQVVASKPDVDISSTCVPTPPPPPPPKRSSSKKKYRAAIRAHRSNADKATEITVTNVSTSVTPQDGAAETQESLGIPVGSREPTLNLTKEKAENHSEEATSSTASDMAPIQLAPAKIVERQMSQRQVSLPSEIEPISADESIKKDRCSDEGTALGDSSLIPKLMQGAKLIRLQLSPPMVQKSQAFDEFSTSDAADMIPMQMAAAKLVGSQLSPTLERGVTRLDERDVPMLANPSTKNAGVIEMARAAMARTQGENAPNSTETTVPYEDKLASASSDGQKLKCLVKLAISEAKNAVGREEKLSDDEAVDESSPSEKANTKADDPFVQKERATFSQFGTDDSNSEHGQFLGSETGTASLVGAAVFDESNAEYETFRNAQIDEVATVSMTEERVVETSSNEFSQNTQKKVSQAVPSTSQEPITDSSSEYESFQFVASQKSTESVVLNSLEGDDTPANGWDTRSILEHPLDTSPSAVPDIDSSWDAARMNFTTEEKKSQDDIDIFDSVSWSHTGSDFSQSAAIAQGAKDNMTRLMLGAIVSGNHGSESNFMAAPTEEIPFEEGLWPSADGPSNIEDATKAPLPNPTKENESLLGGDGRSDIGVENISDMKTEGQLSQKERLELYTNKSAEYISSSEDDDSIADAESLAEESDADDENDDDDEIKYISHNVEIDSDSDESSDSGGLFSRSTLEVNAATLNVADAAATLANNESRDQKHTVDGHFDGPAASTLFRVDGKQILESTSRKTPSSQVAQRAETIKTHTNRAVTAKGSMDLLPSAGINGLPKRIPLLRPPPEEKLKKWEESKLRPFKHLAARKAGGENSTFMDFSSGIKSPLELSGVFDSVPRDLSADGNFVCIDQEMAEKAALVSSMAAELPEEKLKADVQSDENEDIESDILQDNMASMLFCGGTGTLHENLLTKFAPKSFIGCSPNLSTGVGLKEENNSAGGIFSGWQNHPLMSLGSEMLATSKTESRSKDMSCDTPATDPNFTVDISQAKIPVSEDDTLAAWLRCLVLQSDMEQRKSEDARKELRTLLEDNSHFDRVCALVSSKVSTAIMSQNEEGSGHTPMSGKVKEVIPFALGNATQRPHVLAANFVSFVQRIGKLTGITSPFKDENPFLMVLVNESIAGKKEQETDGSMQQLVFDNKGSDALEMTKFFHDVIQAATRMSSKSAEPIVEVSKQLLLDALRAAKSVSQKKRYEIAPEGTPSPFETATWSLPSAVAMLLDFLGDPVVVCRMKMVNRFCNRIISENEQTFMRDAVRLGGMSMNVRPAFWMWITLEKSSGNPMEKSLEGTMDHVKTYPVQSKISKLAQLGREGKWHGVIERDVARAFGNMPPHKTGARFRTDSIVRALVTYGRGRLIKRGVRGGGEAPPISRIATPDGLLPKSKSRSRSSVAPPPWLVGDDGSEGSDASETPTDTVSDWGCVSPVASFTSSVGDEVEIKRQSSRRDAQESISEGEQMQVSRDPAEELALGGNALTHEMKTKLQNQLEFILHTLAAEHDDVGYCQGMDYVVAHLLRILQDTVKWHAMKGCLPSVIIGAEKLAKPLADGSTAVSDEAIAESLVVEEAVFRVMDCFFTTYNLRHIYWPELRSLKICCRVFERLIQHKLPVLADHFEHHELNVGLFALGWFQTLYLYLPSMPAATVCHMWDIWLVERSFKIFFRVGTAILFLSQPILLNHDLEGMMTYLNTFPDATLLKPDILIACALQIKVTNRMLTELETEVTGGL